MADDTNTASLTEAQSDRFDRVKAFLNEHIANSRDDSTVDVIPLQCGMGKSRYTTVNISEVLRQRHEGVLIVTDEVKRLEQYVSEDGKDSYLRKYIHDNIDRVFVITAKNAAIEKDQLYKKQIIAMTTQRFFAMERDDVLKIVNAHHPKPTLIIDERAPLSETIRIDIKVLNDIDTTLQMNLDNTCRQKDKEFLITQWGHIRETFEAIFHDIEASNPDNRQALWYQTETRNATTDDDRFLSLITKTHKEDLQRPNGQRGSYLNIVKHIKAVFQIIHQGGLVVSAKRPQSGSREEYDNFFLVEIDHRDLVTDLGCKTIILDGTGDIDPTYNKYYVNQIDAHQFNRPLKNLTINIVDVNAGKYKLTKRDFDKKILTAIRQFIHRTSTEAVDAIFTYQGIESQFIDDAKMTGHFGAIKGSNRYRDCTNIIQVGLNRERDEYYLCRAIHNIIMRYPDGTRFLSIYNNATAQARTMLKSVLADTEQNIFRSAIRNDGDNRRVTYTILCNYSQPKPSKKKGSKPKPNPLADFPDMVRERYEPYGATVNLIPTPFELLGKSLDERKPNEGREVNNTQKMKCWLETLPPGKTWTPSELCRATGLTRNEYKAAKRNKAIRQMLEMMQTDTEGVYQVKDAAIRQLT